MIPDPRCKYQGRYFHFHYAMEALSGVEGKILDIGCGTGALTHAFKKYRPDLKVYGCDNDQQELTTFRKKYGDFGVKLSKDNAYQLSFDSQEFAAVLIIDVLEHLEQPRKSLQEAVRVLKKRGVFYLVVPLEGELITIDGWLKLVGINLKEKPIDHIQQFRLAEIREMILKSGLEITQIRFSHHFFYQFFSFLYYLYVALFKRGKYWPLASKNKSINRLIFFLESLGGWLTFWESSLLRRIKGQTVHITAKKL